MGAHRLVESFWKMPCKELLRAAHPRDG